MIKEIKKMRTVKIKLYKFDELSAEAKQVAINWFREGNNDSFFADCVIEDAKEIGKLIGIDIDKVYYSGFGSQGDGACFEGNYAYAKNSVKALKDYAPQDKTLHRIVDNLYKLQRENFYGLTAKVKQSGHYYHKMCTEFDVYINGCNYAKPKIEDELIELLRDFMDWIYKQLETDYEYQNSDEQISENIRINEYEFTADGKRA
jgi:hypothetical protein